MPMLAPGKTEPALETPPHDGGFLAEICCALVAVNPAGKIISFNQTAESLTRLPAARVLNGPCDTLPAPLKTLIEEALKGGQTVNDLALTLFPNTPDVTAIQATTALCRDEKQNVLAVLLVFQDLTFTKRMESNRVEFSQ